MAKRNATPKLDPFDAAVTCIEHVPQLLAQGRYAEAENYALAARTHVARIVATCRKATLPARKAEKAAARAKWREEMGLTRSNAAEEME
jgi:hypothetical protein